MKIAIVGASNSVMVDGYANRISPMLAARGTANSVVNLSLGAAPCLRAIQEVKSVECRGSDVIIIEFTVTDYPHFKYFGRALWREAYDAAIRSSVELHPNAHVICLLLGRRDEKYYKLQSAMRDDIYHIAHSYRVSVADFDSHLHSMLPNIAEFKSCYSDHVHYSAPIAPAICANMLCDIIQRGQGAPSTLNGGANRLDMSRSVSFAELCPELQLSEFKNSRFSVDTSFLPLNSSVSISGDVRPVGIEFVSTRDSCDIELRRGAEVSRLHAVHKAVKNNSFSFLLRFAGLQAGNWYASLDEPWTISATSSVKDVGVLPGAGMIPNHPAQEAGVYLSKLLYC